MSTAELSLLKSHLTREYDVCKFWIIHVTSAVAPSFLSTAWFWKRQCDWPRIRLAGTLADARKECQPTDNQYEASIKEMKKEVWIIWQMQPVPFRAVQWACLFKQMRKDALCRCLYRCVLFETPSETKSIKVWKPMETRWSVMWAFAPLVIQKFFMHWAGSIRVWCASVCLIAVLDGMHLFSYHLSSASQDMSFVIAIC